MRLFLIMPEQAEGWDIPILEITSIARHVQFGMTEQGYIGGAVITVRYSIDLLTVEELIDRQDPIDDRLFLVIASDDARAEVVLMLEGYERHGRNIEFLGWPSDIQITMGENIDHLPYVVKRHIER